jgi:prevent-host-death family protein
VVTRTIPAGEFKAKCLALMDEVAATGDEIVITKRGKPVARLKAERPYGPNEPGRVVAAR